MPSTYQLFVKQHMLKLRDSNMKPQDKMKHVAEMWRASKGSDSDEEHHKQHKPKPKKSKKKECRFV